MNTIQNLFGGGKNGCANPVYAIGELSHVAQCLTMTTIARNFITNFYCGQYNSICKNFTIILPYLANIHSFFHIIENKSFSFVP